MKEISNTWPTSADKCREWREDEYWPNWECHLSVARSCLATRKFRAIDARVRSTTSHRLDTELKAVSFKFKCWSAKLSRSLEADFWTWTVVSMSKCSEFERTNPLIRNSIPRDCGAFASPTPLAAIYAGAHPVTMMTLIADMTVSAPFHRSRWREVR